MESYDFCLSLGGSCSAAIQLKRRGLRLASLPFDWLLAYEKGCFARALEVVKGVSAGTECGWLADLERIVPAHEGAGLGPWQYRDRRMGFEFLHDFHCDLACAENQRFLDDVKEVYRRRFARLAGGMKKAKRVLLILDSDFAWATEELRSLRETWAQTFPSVEFQMVAVLWSQATPGDESDDRLLVRRVSRPKHRYDNEETTPVWDFLDDVSVTGRWEGGAPSRSNEQHMPIFYRLVRIAFLGCRKILRSGGWAASVE